jgi:hypothetical protein
MACPSSLAKLIPAEGQAKAFALHDIVLDRA